MLLWLAIAAGFAAEANRMPVASLLVVHELGRENPWGVRIGVEWQFALGDHCTWGEDPSAGECRSSSIWPIVGPSGAISWRGGDRFAFDVGGVGGVSGVEMYDVGFVPHWGVLGKAGFRLATPGPVPAFTFGGYAAGGAGIGARFDVDMVWDVSSPPRPVLGGGLWMALGGATEYQ